MPVMYVTGGTLAILSAVLLKWLLIRRYKPEQQPLWSPHRSAARAPVAVSMKIWQSCFTTGSAAALVIAWFLLLVRGQNRPPLSAHRRSWFY